MPVDFAELQRAMGQNTQAQADFQATEDPYAYAQELRGGANLQPDAYGQISPLQILGDMIGQSTGRRDVRNIEDERKGLSQTMAAAEAMKQNYEAEGVQQARALKQTAEARAVEKNTRDAQVAARNKVNKSETFTNGTDKITARFDEDLGTWVDNDTAPIDLNDWTQDKTASGGRAHKNLGKAEKEEITSLSKRTAKISKLVGTFRPEYSQLGGMPTKFINNLGAGLSKSGLLAIIDDDETLTPQAAAAGRWWSEFLGDYSLEERHSLFGATLTNNERASWEESLNVLRGMNPEDVKLQMQSMVDRKREAASQTYNLYRPLVAGNEFESGFLEANANLAGLTVAEDGGDYIFDRIYVDPYAEVPNVGEATSTADPTDHAQTTQTALVQQEFDGLNPPQDIRDRLSSLPPEIQMQLMQKYIAENQGAEVVEEYGGVATPPKAKRRGQGRNTR